MRRALTQSVPRRGLSHIQGRALRLTPPRGRRRGRGLCCTGALRAQGRGSFQRLCAGRRPRPINRPAVGRKGLPRLRRRKMKRPLWQAGRLTWGLVCMMCRMRQGLFCTAPAGAGAFPYTGARPAPDAPSRAVPGGGAFAAQGRALRLTRHGPPFCLPAHRLPPPPAGGGPPPRRSAVVVVFALCGKEGGGNQQRQRLGRHNGKPDAVQPDKGGQRQHHSHLKHERAQK